MYGSWRRATAFGGAAIVLAAAPGWSQAQSVSVGRLTSGAEVSLVRDSGGAWGIEIAGPGVPRVSQAEPARVEVFRQGMVGEYARDDVQDVSSGYDRVEEDGTGGAIGRAEVGLPGGGALRFEDRWSVSGDVVSLRRRVEVAGNAEGGFHTAVVLATDPRVGWADLDYFAPMLLYGDTARHSDRSPGGVFNYVNRHYRMREDWLSAPLFAVSFRDGRSISVLNPAPRGNTTLAESRSAPGTVMVDERYGFGALGAEEAEAGGVEIGYWYPGTAPDYGSGGGAGYRGPAGQRVAGEAPEPAWRRRYHPIRDGFVQHYEVAFRFGRDEGGFRGVVRNSWRWAWDTLRPDVVPIDVPLLRQTLFDHLADRVMFLPDGRAGIPYLVDSRTGEFQSRMDATRAAMGFCARNIQAADLFLREAERTPGPRGERLRELGLAIIESFVTTLPMSPPAGDGFDLLTGRIAPAVWSVDQQFLRPPAEAMYVVLDAYHRELEAGRKHESWFRWAQDFTDWMLAQQRPDGSFPRSWRPGTNEVVLDDGTASYMAPPLLIAMHRATGQQRYMDAAIRAGEYIWDTDGTRGRYHGGSIDASSTNVVVDSNAGQLALLAFLELYEATQHLKWLERARAAADYSETWTIIWNVPMPEDADDADLHWKKGVPTIGMSGITVRSAGHYHIHLSYAAPLYAKLHRYTGDEHYFDVARVLFHAIDAMVALPGRPHSVLGPGWIQENWRMGPGSPGRGYGSPGKWLPWLGTIRLHAILEMEREAPELLAGDRGS